MDKCINTKHPEFIKLAKQVNMNPLILKSKIGVWQEKNNSDDFPTLEELGSLKTSLGKELEYKDPYVPAGSLKNFKQYQVLDEKNNDIGSVVIEYRGDKTVILHPKLTITGKGYGKDLYKLISSKFNVDIQEWNEGAIANSNAAKKMWDSLEKEGIAKRIVDEEQGDNFRILEYRKVGSEQDIEGVDGRNNFDKDLAQKIQDILQKLYPEIKFNITNNPAWEQGDNIFNQKQALENEVAYRLKVVNSLINLTIPKGDKRYSLGDKPEVLTIRLNSKKQPYIETNLRKRLNGKGVTNQQIDFIFDYMKSNNIQEISTEQLALELASKYGFSVEVNTAIDKESTWDMRSEPTNAKYYPHLSARDRTNKNKYKDNPDWEYQEIEISTPLITPVIKGHPQFATPNGIGWVRVWYNKKTGAVEIQEIQSDLFQRSRGNKKNLITRFHYDLYSSNGFELDGDIYTSTGGNLFYKNDEPIYAHKYEKAVAAYLEKQDVANAASNQFLQLLNKDANWVTFFIKSIIQDTAKKGYEKVLFPKGETAAKIEGHETLANELNLINKELETIQVYKETNQSKILLSGGAEWVAKRGNKVAQFATKEAAEKFNESKVKELEQRKSELKSQGIEKLKPIEGFYEIKVGNILEKLFGKDNVKTITDEHGNQWREITINQARDLKDILLQRNEANQIIGQANIKARTVLVDAINQKQDTLPHEYAHHYIAWFRNTPIVQEAIKKWGSEEALVQSIGEQVVKQKGEAYNWWNKFVKWIMNQFNSLSKLQKEELTQILTDAFLTRQDLRSKQDIEGFKNSKQFQRLTSEEKAKTIEQVTKEHRSITALKDLSAKLAHRIGGRVNFVNRPAEDWKGYNQGMRSVFNEAYMTPDTPFHEILAHPIIRAIKNRNIKNLTIEEQEDTFGLLTSSGNPGIVYTIWEDGKGSKEIFDTKIEAENYIQSLKDSNIIYQNLLKELETGRGKEVLDRVKRDYVYKKRTFRNHYIGDGFTTETTEGETLPFSLEEFKKLPKGIVEKVQKNEFLDITTETINIDGVIYEHTFGEDAKEKVTKRELPKYTLEEQQEEAIVTLLGLMAADKLDAKKDATLISKLKELWKQISDFVKQLLRQDGIIIDELPITTTLNDLAEIMAYGNNHIILPGYKVEYSTPLGNKYETLEEVNNEIRGLANSDVEVDLSDVKLNKEIKGNYYNLKLNEPYYYGDSDFVVYKDGDIFKGINDEAKRLYPKLENKKYYKFSLNRAKWKLEFTEIKGEELRTKLTQNNLAGIYAADDIKDANFTDIEINNFIEKNKKYGQAKKIIELWKKVNNIQYNPEEVYSRGQGFYSSIGAYSNLELDLLLKNLIQHIKDYKKAGGEFTISAFTKPLNTRLEHIEGTGDRVRFVIYPKSNDIKWAAPTDVNSGSVWDASKKVSKDKKSELLGVSFTKAPNLESLNEVSPNLADIIDNLSHAHNELGIELTTNNFRLEYDEDVRYSTKKLIDNINSILDQKYGKLVKPEINIKGKTEKKYELVDDYGIDGDTQTLKTFDTLEEAKQAAYNLNKKEGYLDSEYGVRYSFREVARKQGIQPTQTNETLKESISAIQQNLDSRSKAIPNKFVTKGKHKGYASDTWFYKENGEWYMKYVPFDAPFETKVESHDNVKMSDAGLGIEEVWESYLSTNPEGIEDIKAAEEKYTEQALINLRMAKLKEVARKYPRSLITSKVVPINPNMVDNSEIQYSKVESNSIKDSKVENKVYETDVLIGRFPFSIKGNNTYSVEFINNTSKESYPISVVNDLVYSLNKKNKGKERFLYNPTEKEGYYVINKTAAPTIQYFENKSENISDNLC